MHYNYTCKILKTALFGPKREQANAYGYCLSKSINYIAVLCFAMVLNDVLQYHQETDEC